MKLIQLLLLVVLLSAGVLTAPVREGEGLEGEEQECNVLGSDEDTIQQELDDILEQGLLNNTDNIDKIKRAFNLDPNTVKICVRIRYEVNCTNQEGSEACFDCSANNLYNFTWTNFDPTTLAGALLLIYGTLSIDIFGFEWDGACDLEGLQLSISVPPLTLLCDVEDGQHGQTYISESFNRITRKMPSLINSNNFESNKNYSSADEGFNYGTLIILTGWLYPALFMAIAAVITIQSEAKNKIESKAGKKPKKYFQFWAFHFFACGLMMTTYAPLSVIAIGIKITIFVMVIVFTIGVLYCVDSKRFDLNTPIHCPCCWRCRNLCHYMAIVCSLAIIFIFASVCILLIPNIIFVYYLYPTRTLVRLPLVINAVLYINTALAVLIFQCERCCHSCRSKNDLATPREVIELNCEWCCHSCRNKNEEERDMIEWNSEDSEIEEDEEDEEDLDRKEGHRYEMILMDQLERERRRTPFSPISSGGMASIVFNCMQKRFICKRRCRHIRKFCLKCLQVPFETPFQERHYNHVKFYDAYYKKATSKRDCVKYSIYCIHPVATFVVLILLILAIVIISELITIHHKSNQDNQLELIITLVPTFLLLFGSWYNLDIFYVDDKEKDSLDKVLKKHSEESTKLLSEILDKLPSTNSGRDRPDRQGGEHNHSTLEDNQHSETSQDREDDQRTGEHETILIEDDQTIEDIPSRTNTLIGERDTASTREPAAGELISVLDDDSGTQPQSTHEETGSQLTIQVVGPQPPNKTKSRRGNKTKKVNEQTLLMDNSTTTQYV